MLNALKRTEVVLFLDECVFTQRSLIDKIWSKKNEIISIEQKKTSFKAIAVVGAIDVYGELVAHVLREGTI